MLYRKTDTFDDRLGLEGVFETPSVSDPEPLTVPAPPVPPVSPPKVEAPPVIAQASPPQADLPKKQQSLDDLIFDFLSTGDDGH